MGGGRRKSIMAAGAGTATAGPRQTATPQTISEIGNTTPDPRTEKRGPKVKLFERNYEKQNKQVFLIIKKNIFVCNYIFEGLVLKKGF